MYIAVCDDQAPVLQEVTKLLEAWQKQHRLALRFRCFQSAVELLSVARKERFSLYLLDVMMPGSDGLATAREIREFDSTADIVFMTTSPEFAYESYRVRALDYLLKPIPQDLLFSILDRLLQQEQAPQEGLILKCGAAYVRVPYYELAYVEVNGKHLYFNLADGTVRQVYGTLREFGPQLLARPEFKQVHRSYIVNILQVEELSSAGIRTFSGKHVPVSRLLYPQIQKDYMELLFKGRRG